MRKLLMPVMNRNYSDEEISGIVSELKRADADMAMLVYHRVLYNREQQLKEREMFISLKGKLENAGIAVGAWVCPTVGYGAPYYYDHDAPFTKLHTIKGNGDVVPGGYCPLDERFTDELCAVFEDVARTGVTHILLEDDFTMSGGKVLIDRLCCCCEKHMEEYRRLLGEEVAENALYDLIYRSTDKKYRKTWMLLQGNTLKMLAQRIEKAVHAIDENIRIGLSANGTSYTVEGIPVYELAKIVAGKNRPFMRTTAAPYWKNNRTFAANIEASRLQNEWCGGQIDLFCEGDTYPRPRHNVPSALLEGFDTVLSAEGKVTGILKYMLDYNSNSRYETGYIDRHVKNREVYEEITKKFACGKTVGLNVLEDVRSFSDTDFGCDCEVSEYGNCNQGYLPFPSQLFACDNSIPTTYGNPDGASLVFGANANYITEEHLKNGVILDATAAKILISRGIDIGITDFERAEKPAAEKFWTYDDMAFTSFERKGSFYRYKLKSTAKVLSSFYVGPSGLGIIPDSGLSGLDSYPACYIYENAQKQRFMVYSFAAVSVTVYGVWSVGLFRNYYRQKQLAAGIEWLQGRPLPAMCFGNPELYILCKRDQDKLAVGIWNFFPDEVLEPVIELDGKYAIESSYRCNGKIDQNKLCLENSIPPFGFVFFTLKEA